MVQILLASEDIWTSELSKVESVSHVRSMINFVELTNEEKKRKGEAARRQRAVKSTQEVQALLSD
jgi:hypothetical protein